MEGPRDHLLAATSLPLEHDRQIARRYLAQLSERFPKSAAAPESGRDLLERPWTGGHDSEPTAQSDDVARTDDCLVDEATVDANAVAAAEIGDRRPLTFRASAQDGVTA